MQRRAVLRRGRADGGCCLHRFFADLEVQHHLEAGALAQLALQRDDTAHHVHDVLGDGHAQAGALHLVGHRILGPAEGLVNVLLERFAHADAVVGDGELVAGIVAAAEDLLHIQRDAAAMAGVLDRIGQDVEQYLPQAGGVAFHILVEQIVDLYGELLVPQHGLLADHAVHLRDLLGHAEGLDVQGGLAAFDLAHVQDLVDEVQQMPAGGFQLVNVALQLARVLQVVFHQAGQAHDGVHRGTDVVRHVAQEGGLGRAGALRLLQGRPQLSLAFLQFLVQLPGLPGGFLGVCLSDARPAQRDKDDRQDHPEEGDQHHGGDKKIILYKVGHGHLFQRGLVHGQRTRQHGGRDRAQGLVQDRHQGDISACHGKRDIAVLREENAVEPFVLTVLRNLARFGKQAVVFAAAHGCLGILQGIVLDDVPVRIVVRNVPFQQQVILQQSNGVRMVLVEGILRRDRRHVQGQDRVGQNEVVLFRYIGVLGKMEDEVDLAVFQGLDLLFHGIIPDQ